MTTTVSISQFRQNISNYLTQVREGNTIILKDEKKGQEVAQIVGKKNFDLESFKRTLHRVAGTFTAENHPEWRTKRDVIKWVERERAKADRTF